jgi:hypothetical protein
LFRRGLAPALMDGVARVVRRRSGGVTAGR